MHRGIAALVLLIAGSQVHSDHPDDLPRSVLEVAHTLQHNRDLLGSVPMYTCLETISREQKEPKQRKARALDVVQVDVGIGRGEEIYSWPGQDTFSSGGLMDLVGQGYLATGIFDTFARNLFIANVGLVQFAGEQAFQNADTLHFTYSVPSLSSKWDVDWLGAQGVVGESGEFWVDKKTLTLLTLDVAATSIPPNLPLKSLTVKIDYQTLAIGQTRALIPSGAENIAVELNGTAYRNAIAFSQCHVFEAESGISDSSQGLAKAVAGYEEHRTALPAGLYLFITLQSEIHAGRVKIGDAITGRLDKPVKISPEIIAPGGAIVKGRVREFRQLQDPPNTFEVGLAFDELAWPTHIASFFAEAVSMEQEDGLSTFISRGTSRSMETVAGVLTNSMTQNVWPSEMPGVATFFLTGTESVPKGFQIRLRTLRTRAR